MMMISIIISIALRHLLSVFKVWRRRVGRLRPSKCGGAWSARRDRVNDHEEELVQAVLRVLVGRLHSRRRRCRICASARGLSRCPALSASQLRVPATRLLISKRRRRRRTFAAGESEATASRSPTRGQRPGLLQVGGSGSSSPKASITFVDWRKRRRKSYSLKKKASSPLTARFRQPHARLSMTATIDLCANVPAPSANERAASRRQPTRLTRHPS